MATKLLYLEDFDVVAGEATVAGVEQLDDGRTDVVLDQTCFYPRGGGQDWDDGMIGDFVVDEVRLDAEGVVHHLGQGKITKGEQVKCQVDAERRSVNTRLHSAGHVLDMVMSELRPDWIPAKGAHYPHMSFVEYEVPAGTEVDDTFVASVQNNVHNYVQSDSANYQNQIKFIDKADMGQYCRHIPDNIPSNKPTRIVLYADNFGIPCGGTHAKQVKDIGEITITKLKVKKGIAKVSYAVTGIN